MAIEVKKTFLHVTQDARGRWSLTAVRLDGSRKPLIHSASSREHIIEEAQDLIKNGAYLDAEITDAPLPPPSQPRTLSVGVPTSDPTSLPVSIVSKHIYWTSDGGGAWGGEVARALFHWIYQQKPDLVVYGGDVYGSGADQEFAEFGQQVVGDANSERGYEMLRTMWAVTGNHDWHTLEPPASNDPCPASGPPPYPSGYENFWKGIPAPITSKPRVDTTKFGGARYENYIDLNGWRLIFLDTGALDSGTDYNLQNVFDTNPWPMGDQGRVHQLDQWLDQDKPDEVTRANIVFAHHSRLSCGQVGDNYGLDTLWKTLFKWDQKSQKEKARAIFTLAGHDHNVSVYKPVDSGLSPVDDDSDGIGIIVNGAGGENLMYYTVGTVPTLYPPNASRSSDTSGSQDYNYEAPCDDSLYGFCATKIELQSYDLGEGRPVVPFQAIVTILNFGCDPSPSPTVLWGPHIYSLDVILP